MSTETIQYKLSRVATGSSNMVKPPAVSYAVGFSSPPSTSSSFSEENRRNNIIKYLVEKCPYKVNDVVRPTNDAAFAKEGFYRITGFANTYQLWKGTNKNDDEWPSTDNPMIVHAIPLTKGAPVFATVSYFKLPETNDPSPV